MNSVACLTQSKRRRVAQAVLLLMSSIAGCAEQKPHQPLPQSSIPPGLPPAAMGGAAATAAQAGQAGRALAVAGASGTTVSSAGVGAAGSQGVVGRDGGSIDSDDAGPVSMSGCSGAVFCDTFDDVHNLELDFTRWESLTPNCSGTGEVRVDADVAHSGGYSVRVRGGAGYCNHTFLRAKLNANKLPDPLYGRFFMRLDAPLASGHVTFLALRDAHESKDLRMGGQSEILMWNRESDDATLPELSPAGIALSVRLATRSWQCIEFMIARSHTLQTWVDGQSVPGLQVDPMPTPDVDAQWDRKADWQPEIEDAKFGWESYGDQSNTLWFDDVALGPSRIGCGR